MEKITIELHEKDGFTVSQGNKSAIGLGYDEMLGLISAMTLPEKRGILHWLRTKEENEDWEKRYSSKDVKDKERAEEKYNLFFEVGVLWKNLLQSKPSGDQDIDKLR